MKYFLIPSTYKVEIKLVQKKKNKKVEIKQKP
jgi:hypothetical protein